MNAEMTTTTGISARLPRLIAFGLLALAIALTLALPATAGAKKHPHKKCTATHAKGHKAKHKRCAKPVARRRGWGRSQSAPQPSGAQTNATAPASDDVARCQREQAQNPAGFADLYGVGAEDEGAFDTCVTSSHDNSSTEGDSAEDSG